MFDMLSRLDSSCDYVPPMYEGMKCYQFEIDVKNAQKSTGHQRGGSFFGGILKKWTTN
jgi:hypothetical protein